MALLFFIHIWYTHIKKEELPTKMLPLIPQGNNMLSHSSKSIKYLTQQIYNEYIFSFDFTTCSCSCGATGRFVMHGYYTRSIKTPIGKIKLKILRVKCKSCGKTHAILHASIVPYSQVVLNDTTSIIINYENNESIVNILNDNPEITESDVRYTINKFKKDWKERIISIASIPILMFLKQDDLQEKVSKCFKRAFMQIKSCFYQLF